MCPDPTKMGIFQSHFRLVLQHTLSNRAENLPEGSIKKLRKPIFFKLDWPTLRGGFVKTVFENEAKKWSKWPKMAKNNENRQILEKYARKCGLNVFPGFYGKNYP